MWPPRESKEDNPQLLTLVHGVDPRGRHVIREYTGDACNFVWHKHGDAINKNSQNPPRFSTNLKGRISKDFDSHCRVINSSSINCLSNVSGALSQANGVLSNVTPSISGTKSRTIWIPKNFRGLRATVCRLSCSLTIHSGFGWTSGEYDVPRMIPSVPYRESATGERSCREKKIV